MRQLREIFSNGNNSEYSQDSSEEMDTNLGIEERFRNIENQLAIILERLDKGVEENDNRDDMQDRHDKFCDMLAKINLLEREKRELKDENFALRLEIINLKQFIGEKINNRLSPRKVHDSKENLFNIFPGDLTFAEVTGAENYAISPNKDMSVRKLQEKCCSFRKSRFI